MDEPITVYLETAVKRAFAGAVEWPGWSRSGRGDDQALEALAAYRSRYAAVLAAAKLVGPASARFEVVERLAGNATTDFGAPGIPPAADERPLDEAELERQQAILRASWVALEQAAAGAAGIELRKGPRGGGRDVDRIVEHVVGAEAGYLTQLGAKAPPGVAARDAILAALAARARGEAPAAQSRVKRPWSPRYFVRRAAWHVLDHAWEIEDRASPDGDSARG